jgi:murein DD-endopeptidase
MSMMYSLGRLPTFALMLALLARICDAERAPLIESLDLAVPFQPVLVKIDARPHLVHELHLSNFLANEVVLKRITVRSAAGDSLAAFEGEALAKIIGRPGLRSNHATPLSIAPGMRAVAFFWFPVGRGAQDEIVHEVTVEALRPAGAAETMIRGGKAKISSETAVALDPPLRGGPWVAIYDPLLKGGHRTAFYTLDGKARIPARFAIDWVRLTPEGIMDVDNVARSSEWNGYGADVLAVADGIVAAAIDDMPDNAPGSKPGPFPPEAASGNYVALDLGNGRFAFYEHLKQGSISAKTGDRVKRGQVIAKLGNSGSSSIGPHLHFHVSDAKETLAAEGFPFVVRSFERLGVFPSIEALVRGERWNADPAGQEKSRHLERPAPNSVINFP